MDVSDRKELPTAETCETCRFWSPNAWEFWPGYGECQRITHAGSDEPPEAGTPAFTSDGEDYRSGLYTGPTFGCVLHQPTVATTPPAV
jgi:hypothetical protein